MCMRCLRAKDENTGFLTVVVLWYALHSNAIWLKLDSLICWYLLSCITPFWICLNPYQRPGDMEILFRSLPDMGSVVSETWSCAVLSICSVFQHDLNHPMLIMADVKALFCSTHGYSIAVLGQLGVRPAYTCDWCAWLHTSHASAKSCLRYFCLANITASEIKFRLEIP